MVDGSGAKPPRIFLQGPPKAGKTTVVDRLATGLRDSGVSVAGILTREVRQNGERVGFVLSALDTGDRATIARRDVPSNFAVGRYGVDLAALERVAFPALERALGSRGIVVIDEIARIELASADFVRLVLEILARPIPVVATVHVFDHPVSDQLICRPDVEVVHVTAENRDELPAQLLGRFTGQ